MDSISNAADQAAHAMNGAASQTRDGLLDLGKLVVKLALKARDMESLQMDRWLHRMGLQRREGIAQPALLFAAGAILGAGAGLLLAPTTGTKLRQTLVELCEKQIEKFRSEEKDHETALHSVS